MTGQTDPVCGCPLVVFVANRRDRRDRRRRGEGPPVLVVKHRRHGCSRAGRLLSDPGRSGGRDDSDGRGAP